MTQYMLSMYLYLKNRNVNFAYICEKSLISDVENWCMLFFYFYCRLNWDEALFKLTIPKLKDELSSRELDTSGKKPDLVERLKKHLESMFNIVSTILSRATSHGAPWLRWLEDGGMEGSRPEGLNTPKVTGASNLCDPIAQDFAALHPKHPFY